MPAGKTTSLPDRALVRIAGADAEKFLQGLVTCDLAGMAPGDARFGALLSPQGKILFDFFLIRSTEGFIADMALSMRDDFVRRLALYKLRADVEVGPFDPRTGVYASWGGDSGIVDGIRIADPRLLELGYRLYCRREPEGVHGKYEAHRISLGMPEGGKDFSYGECFPHEALMDLYGAVSFTKGCFVGQEVVSRVRHRATARSRFVMVKAQTGLPSVNTEILAGGKPAGRMGSSAGKDGMALLRLDRAATAMASGLGLTAGSLAIEASIPVWAGFDWPTQGQ